MNDYDDDGKPVEENGEEVCRVALGGGWVVQCQWAQRHVGIKPS